MRPTPELDEGCLQLIFDKVGNVRQLARCSMVRKRWRDACYSGTFIEFEFETKTQEEMRAHEDTMATVLQRARINAPGCLKQLIVNLRLHRTTGTARTASGHWLALADSLTLLVLITPRPYCSWGPALWSYLVTSQTLEGLVIRFDSGTFLNGLPPMQGWTSPRLKHCHFDSLISVELLERLLAACPVLDSLHVYKLALSETQLVLTVSRNSLTALYLSGARPCSADRFQVLFQDVPNLACLSLSRLGQITDIRAVHPMEKLTDLELNGLCTLDGMFNQVVKLTLMGQWNIAEEVGSVLKYTPGITNLNLVDFRGPLIISSLLPKLQCLKHILVDKDSLLCLDSDVKLEEITVRVQFWCETSGGAGNEYRVLKNLLDTCRVRGLVLEFQNLDPRSEKPKLVDDLCGLLALHPDRTSVEFTE